MRKSISLLVLLAALTPGFGSAREPAEPLARIELQDQVTTRGRQVQLGDIATIHTHDLATIQRLVALPLGQAPRVNAEAVVRRDVVARWVRSQLGLSRDQVQWSGAQETVVRCLGQELPAQRIEAAATTALREWLAQRVSRFSLDAVPSTNSVDLPAGAVQLAARPIGERVEPAPRMVVWVDVQVDGVHARSIPVTFDVEAYRPAWVARAPIAPGAAVPAAALERREVRVAGASSAAWSNAALADSAAPWQATKAVRRGEAITPRNAAPAPVVARGEWVALHMKSGLVELESRAQALQDGELGRVVQVRSSGSASPVPARVVAPGRVEALL